MNIKNRSGPRTDPWGRVCLKYWSSSYEELLLRANLSTLSKRRSHARMCHLFKIIHNLTDFPEAPLQSRSFHYSSRSNNSLPYQCHSTQFLNSFFPRTTSLWNNLPTEAVILNSVASFKHLISNFIQVTCIILAFGYPCIPCSCCIRTEIVIDKKKAKKPRVFILTQKLLSRTGVSSTSEPDYDVH